MSETDKPKIVTFRARLDEFLFLGVEQAVTNSTDFGKVWDYYFKTAGGSGLGGEYDYIIWYYKNNEQIFFVGKMVDGADEIPEGFSLVKFPACEYFVVTHEACENLHDGIFLTQSYVGIGQTHDYREHVPMPDGYMRFDGPDSPITQIENENANATGGGRFERWVPIKKIDG
ncbi:MAG: GyrI-like domain-containing protein [Oscillospiraceae bacterium]|nr:GyrI-like domain-containing protein [Oscillospiraceae bacterium]